MNGSRIASYSCTALNGTNKTGAIKPDAFGYYTLVVGALNVENSVGAFYPYEPAKHLFDDANAFQRRIANGSLHGECGHPRMVPGMNTRDFMARCMDVVESNICCHFRRIYLEHGTVKDERGRPMIAIIAEVCPAGPMGPALKAALENPSQNVCFSIRSFTQDTVQNGRTYKNLKTIITFDWVMEPGISIAKKWFSPALEARHDIPLVPPMLNEIIRLQKAVGSGFESGGMSAESIAHELGWDGGVESLIPQVVRPASARWQ
jgi:Peptidase S80 family